MMARYSLEGEVAPEHIVLEDKPPMVFLGGTVNGSLWRDKIIPLLKIDYYNPVVPEWNDEMQQKEYAAKERAVCQLYVITPKQIGYFTFAELSVAAVRDPVNTIAVFLEEDDGMLMGDGEKRSVVAVLELLKTTGANVAKTLEEAAELINEQYLNGLQEKTPEEEEDKKIDPPLPGDDTTVSEESKDGKWYDHPMKGKTHKGLLAVIIKGNPKYIRKNPLATQYYNDIKEYLLSLGVSKVVFDPGKPYTAPREDADLYIGHSRGVERLQYLPPQKKRVCLKFGVPDGIMDSKDRAHTTKNWKGPKDTPKDYKPVDEHFKLIQAQKNAMKTLVERLLRQKAKEDEHIDSIRNRR